MHDSLVQSVRGNLERAATEGALDRVATELAVFARLVAGAPRLAKLLADGDVSSDAKRSLVDDLVKQRFYAVTLDVLTDVVGRRQVTARRLPNELAELAAEAGFAAADKAGALGAVEGALYAFGQTVRGNVELRSALNNSGAAVAVKESLVGELLAGKADERAIALIKVLVAVHHGRDLDEHAEALSALAAERRGKTVAVVRTAVELDDDRRRNLTAALEQTMGRAIEPRFVVDPTIVGSVVVRVGDEVLDGSVRLRLEQARRALVGAA